MRNILFTLLVSLSISAQAMAWDDLWLTKNQQAHKFITQKQFVKAQEKFDDPSWKATAAYRAGAYEKAALAYESLKTEEGYYNQGNALAHMGQYEAALKAYEKTLRINPSHADALYNQKIIQKLLKQEKKNQDQQKQNQQKQDQQNQDQQKQNQQNQDQQKQDQQNQDQQNQDKQKQDQQNQDKQKQDQQNQAQQNQAITKKNHSSTETEKQRANEQWLKLIPDDPGGLMREKFLRDHLRRQNGWEQ